MTLPKNDRFLRALKRQDTDRTPVWIMRQAGRYLPEYRQTRRQAGDFLTLCRTPELACEVTLQPLRRYDLDAAIIFSDILVIPDAMGLGLRMEESVGPVFENPITSGADIRKLVRPDPEDDLGYVMDAVRTTASSLDGAVPLIGFSGSPWTLAVYMIEGRSKTDFGKILAFAKSQTADLHQLLDILARSAAEYLAAKARAGASALMIFDTWGGLLDTPQYLDLSLRYMQRIVEELSIQTPGIPTILFTKGGGKWLENMADAGCSAIGIDWTVDIGDARRRVGDRTAIQGNLNPDSLRLSDEQIEQQVTGILESFGPGNGHIFNLGHGIKPDIDPNKVSVLVDAVARISPQFH
ncbi:MAG: uroporphyrinogen decarboxylase [Acidiferrobacterales bacterium]|nr:uroporphyrinogen decarboxylase [Acidiferrobacterales bacterium]